jgi:type IV pilus secretin PilQ/predicted competence protein
VLLAILLLPPFAAAEEMTDKLVTIHAMETPLSDVLQILSEKSGLNIVASTDVQGKMISIRIKSTPVEEALNLIVRAAGLGYERIGNSILVADENVLQKETGLSTYVIPLHFADAFELVDVVKNITEAVTADPGGNRLVVVASPGTIEQIRSIIHELDVPPVQIMLETEVIEVSTTDLMELGLDWSKLAKQTVLFTEGTPDPSAPDEYPSEMAYQALGIDNDDIHRQAQLLEVALDFLESDGRARILTRANLVTLNNRQAEIHIGDVIPYTVTGTTTGGVIEVSVEREEVGVEVTVTPRASGDGHITAIVEPNVSSIVSFVGPNNEIPWTKERRATTQVRVRDGQTFMLAGLLTEDTTEDVTKVPILGDIPILGHIFRHTREEVKNTDLIIKITPSIIS